MHPELLAALTDPGLSQAAQRLLAYVYAHTNGTLDAVIDVERALTDLRVTEGTLRRTRAELFSAGWMQSRVRGSDLECGLTGVHERAPSARSDRESAHLVREQDAGEDEAERAPSARNAHLVRAVDNSKRAPSARSERDERDSPPFNPPIGIVKYMAGRPLKSASQPGSARGDAGAGGDERARQVLLAAGVSEWKALELAPLGLEAVAKHVADWQRAKRMGKPLRVGALVNQLEEWPVPVDVPPGDLQDGVLKGVVTDDDLDAWGVERPRDWRDGYNVPPGFEGLIKQ